MDCCLFVSGAFLKLIKALRLLKLIRTLHVHQLSCVFQVKPTVVPLLQGLLTEGTFQASSLDSGAASSSGGGGGEQGAAGNVEECAARLVFTSEKPLPWLEKLATQIKASRKMKKSDSGRDHNSLVLYNHDGASGGQLKV